MNKYGTASVLAVRLGHQLGQVHLECFWSQIPSIS